MKYIVYITINLKDKLNGQNRVYVGIHKIENPEMFDDYLGDGVRTKQANTFMFPKSPFQCAVKKFGANSFIRIALYSCNDITEAINKRKELFNEDFIRQDFVYNVLDDFNDNKIYQYNKNGKLIKIWDSIEEVVDFFSYPAYKFNLAIKGKYLFLEYFWAEHKINIDDYDVDFKPHFSFFYTKGGKLLYAQDYYEKKDIDYINNQVLVDGKFYRSNKTMDKFIIKPRRQYLHKTFYVYNNDGTFIGKYVGKELMKVIDLHSWAKISKIFSQNNNWYKNFYITLQEVDSVPVKENKNYFDVYKADGKFVERINSIKELKDRYNIPNARIKDIQRGVRYFGDYIFKYNSK